MKMKKMTEGLATARRWIMSRVWRPGRAALYRRQLAESQRAVARWKGAYRHAADDVQELQRRVASLAGRRVRPVCELGTALADVGQNGRSKTDLVLYNASV